jgi:hypothetical protein
MIEEEYAESPGRMREVQYFDKARMEIIQRGSDDDELWYVTTGLLATELVTGRLQVGDNLFEMRTPAGWCATATPSRLHDDDDGAGAVT